MEDLNSHSKDLYVSKAISCAMKALQNKIKVLESENNSLQSQVSQLSSSENSLNSRIEFLNCKIDELSNSLLESKSEVQQYADQYDYVCSEKKEIAESIQAEKQHLAIKNHDLALKLERLKISESEDVRALKNKLEDLNDVCLLYTSPSPRDS